MYTFHYTRYIFNAYLTIVSLFARTVISRPVKRILPTYWKQLRHNNFENTQYTSTCRAHFNGLWIILEPLPIVLRRSVLKQVRGDGRIICEYLQNRKVKQATESVNFSICAFREVRVLNARNAQTMT